MDADLLGVLLQELSQPLSTTELDLARIHQSLRRLSRSLSALRAAHAELSGDASLMPLVKRRTISRALAAVARPGLKVRDEVPSDLAVLAAPGAVEAVLDNLLRNAVRHSGRALVTVRARPLPTGAAPWPADARVRLTGPAVVLTVADTGPGVPAEIRSRLFLGRVEKPSPGGFGLGLWLCRLIVRAHGGDLWLDETRRGASFSSVWPGRRGAGRSAPVWPSDPIEFGVAVRRARTVAGLSRMKLADRLGISEATLKNVEQANHRVSDATKQKIIHELGSPPSGETDR